MNEQSTVALTRDTTIDSVHGVEVVQVLEEYIRNRGDLVSQKRAAVAPKHTNAIEIEERSVRAETCCVTYMSERKRNGCSSVGGREVRLH